MDGVKEKVIEWLLEDTRGLSAECMARCAAGLPLSSHDITWGPSHPHDPDDLNRCLLLLQRHPEIRGSFKDIAGLSNEWNALIANWGELEQLFLNEVGLNCCKGTSAPKTFLRMQELIYKQEPS